MPLFDLPLPQLHEYQGSSTPPEDLQDFWETTLSAARAVASVVRAEPVAIPLTAVRTDDVTFSGHDGSPIRAWLHRPASPAERSRVIVRYQGYGSGRGHAHALPLEALAGHTVLVMDNRGQSSNTIGSTPDPAGTPASVPGFLSRGLADPATSYYVRLQTDAVLAVDAARELTGTDHVGVRGVSQGGALALTAAALHPAVAVATIDVPFLSDLPRARDLASSTPYLELVQYFATNHHVRDAALRSLSYSDISNLAPLAGAPALFSAGLTDTVCPPSTVFAAFNRYGGPKRIEVYPDNGHEGGGSLQDRLGVEFLADQFTAAATTS